MLTIGTRPYAVGNRSYVVGNRSYVVGNRSYVVGNRPYVVGNCFQVGTAVKQGFVLPVSPTRDNLMWGVVVVLPPLCPPDYPLIYPKE